jgi:hypothetical protein
VQKAKHIFFFQILVVKPVGMAAGTTWLIVVVYIN